MDGSRCPCKSLFGCAGACQQVRAKQTLKSNSSEVPKGFSKDLRITDSFKVLDILASWGFLKKNRENGCVLVFWAGDARSTPRAGRLWAGAGEGKDNGTWEEEEVMGNCIHCHTLLGALVLANMSCRNFSYISSC